MSNNIEIIDHCNKLASTITKYLGDDICLFMMCSRDNKFELQYNNQDRESIALEIGIRNQFDFDELVNFLDNNDFDGAEDIQIVVPDMKTAVYIMAILQMQLQAPMYPYHLMWSHDL